MPGCPEGPTAAGYSWLVQILPFMEEKQIYSEILEASNNYRRKTAFDPTMVRPRSAPHFSES